MTSRLRLAPLAALCAFIAPAACGDDDSSGDGSLADAGGPDAAPATATAFAVATDFENAGVASTVAIPALDVAKNAIEGVASIDPVVRRLGDRLFIVNRLGQDNVTVLDSSPLGLVAQISTGPGSNPQDVTVLGDTIFVAALAAPGILVLDLERPDAGVIETIDLSGLDPADGVPDCSTIAAIGEQIVAVCGLLDENFQPRGPGALALIDGVGRKVIDTASLTQIRPFGLAQLGADQASILVPTLDDFLAPAGGGCVERVQVTEDSVDSGGCLAPNADLGGFASAIAVDRDGGRVWMTITSGFDPDPIGALVSVAADGGAVEHIDLADDVRPVDVALCPTGHLALSDASRGLRVLTADAAQELTRAPLDLGLPPVSNGLVCY